MAIFGLTLLTLGIKLFILDGSLYYAIAGLTLLVTGALLIIQRAAAIGIYAAFLLGSTVWSLAETGLDWWQLVPRLSLWFVLGLLLWLPWFRKPLVQNDPSPKATSLLGLSVILAGTCAIATQFTSYGDVSGDLGRDSTEMTSAAPTQPK